MPETATPPRPAVSQSAADANVNLKARVLYLRSYLFMRTMIGFMGLLLPIVLIAGDSLLIKGEESIRGSLSAYYYSGMRDVFVGSLWAIGIFLITYKVFENNLDNTLSLLAGLAAVVIALFPTKRPDGVAAILTPLQDGLGEATVSRVHYSAAAVFVLSLAIISFVFGVREGKRTSWRNGRRTRMSPGFWRGLHWVCSALILLAVAFMVVTTRQRWFTHYNLLVGEVVAIMAFGLSWLTKGLELDVLLASEPATGSPVEETAVDARR
jgi:hypothetical protein